MLCGSSCVKYILNGCGKNLKINEEMNWIMELALSLKESGLSNIKILNYNSNLYEDYKIIGKDNLSFDGFAYIDKVLNDKIPLIEKSLDAKILKQEIKQNKFIILCVESSIFNNDINMDRGHFVILSEVNEGNFVKVINPIKEEYETKYLSLNFLIKCCENYGSWRVLVKEEK